MKKFQLRLTVAALALTFSGGLMAKTLVTVNGQDIDSSEIDTQVAYVVKESKNQVKDSAELRQNLLNRMVTQTLIIQEAKKQKIQNSDEYKKIIADVKAQAKASGADKDAGFAQDLAQFENDLLVQGFMFKTVEKKPITDKAVKAEYEKVVGIYKGTDEIQLGEIVTSKQKDAAAAIKDLSANKDFKATAKKYSEDPEAKKTGGVKDGYVRLKDLETGAKPLYDALNPLQKGQFTNPALESKDLANQSMYAIFKINDRRAVAIPKFDEVQNDIKANLQNQSIDQAIGDLYKKAKITEK